MIERYTIKFSQALNQKELEKALQTALAPEQLAKLHLVKARVELLADFADLQRLASYLKEASKSHE
jgi:hypothetical protein